MTKREAAEKVKAWIELGKETVEAFDMLFQETADTLDEKIDPERPNVGGLIDPPHGDTIDPPGGEDIPAGTFDGQPAEDHGKELAL